MCFDPQVIEEALFYQDEDLVRLLAQMAQDLVLIEGVFVQNIQDILLDRSILFVTKRNHTVDRIGHIKLKRIVQLQISSYKRVIISTRG